MAWKLVEKAIDISLKKLRISLMRSDVPVDITAIVIFLDRLLLEESKREVL